MTTKNPLKSLKNPKGTQAIVENLVLGDLIDKAVMSDLSKRFKEFGTPIVAGISMFLVPFDDQKKPIQSLSFDQPSPNHLKAKRVVITTNFSKVLDKLID